MNDKLRECPFCGEEAALGASKDGFFVNCISCTASTDVLLPHGNTEEEAIELWNARYTPKHETVEELREKFHEYAKYDDLNLYEIVYDPGCVGEYTQGFKDYVHGYIDMGLIKDVQDKDYGVPEKYLHKPEIER